MPKTRIKPPLEVRDDLTTEDLKRLAQSGIVAIDTETTGINLNRDILCLVQLCDANGQVDLIRASNWATAHNLQELLADERIVKVAHYAVFEYSILFRFLGVDTKNLYCTKIASKLARTYSPSHSLRANVKEFFDLELNKTEQSSDWLKEPLTSDQMKYAANDVVWLIRLKGQLDDILNRKGLLPSGISYAELNEQCRRFIPTLAHLLLNGWNSDEDPRNSVFSH